VREQDVVGSVMDGDDFASDNEVAPDGDQVILGRTRIGDGDDDVWLRKADAGDGTDVWTSGWSGMGDGMFSTDRAFAVTVADDGSVWAAVREHVDFDSQEAKLLHFSAGGDFVDQFQPQPSGDHSHDPIDVVAAGGSIYFAMEKNDFPYRGWLYKLGTDGTEEWVKTEADWPMINPDTIVGEDWAIEGLGVDADGNLGVGGDFGNEEEGQGIVWSEAWTAKLDGAGEIICRSSYKADDGAALPPTINIYAATYSSAGFGLLGVQTSAQGNMYQTWTGFFLP
jgi:hypothetical protein